MCSRAEISAGRLAARRLICALALLLSALSAAAGSAPAVSAAGYGAPTGASGDGWRASGCPVATPAQAAAPAPGAPVRVRAIAGDGSVTVRWCPAARGQGSVVSYTVLSSSGQRASVSVPNDWAIIDGLSNGSAYSFTVRAVSGSGVSSTASAPTGRVVPAPLPRPRDVVLGRPQSVTFDQYSLIIGGKRTVVYSGEFDPWRLPSPALWLDRLEKMKADGLNAVTPYFDWGYHSASPGVYNFSGVRDVNLFLNDAQKAGLYVIARPGPYINAETDAGGFPGWLVTQQGMARSDAPDYVAAALQWYSEIDPIIAAHLITRGGDVILYQVENELEYNDASTSHYMAELKAKARADGIDVPLTGNHNGVFQGGTGAVEIPGYDQYPLGFDCSNTSTFATPKSYTHQPGVPLLIPEFQGGSFDPWGGAGYDACYQLTGPAFMNVFYKNNLAQGVTIQSNYMTVGGTNWGWLPAPFMYTSYDYGSPIRESGEIGTPADPNSITGSKYGENKLLGDFIQSVPSLAKTDTVTPPDVSNPAITVLARANPDDGTQFVYLRQSNASSTATLTTHLALSDEYPSVPQQPGTAITLQGRDARLLLTGYSFGGQRLQYSTSELMTQAMIGGRAVALFYGPKGTDGETVLRYSSEPKVSVLAGHIDSTWSAAAGDLRLDYVHDGLAEVLITGGGRPPLLLLLAEKNLAEDFWPQVTAAGPALVQGAYLVRTALARAGTLQLTGDTSAPGPITVWAAPSISQLSWNGRAIATRKQRDGALSGELPGPVPESLPALTGWRFKAEAPEAQPSFNDGSWTLADHPVTTNPARPVTTPVLYADDYGFHQGFVWYRGHFTATGQETGITLTANGGSHGALAVWLNGTFLGSLAQGSKPTSTDPATPQTRTFSFPSGVLRPGADNVIAVLTENSGHDEDGAYGVPPIDSQKNPRGLLGATLRGSTAPVTWRLQGNAGGEDPADPVRGPYNATGLYGTNHGWSLPGYPDASWTPVSLPDTWAAKGLSAGIGWYRTTFTLSLPARSYIPVAVQVNSSPSGSAANSRAFIFLNGWLVGQYDNLLGPQHQFYVPAGILNQDGNNTIAIAEWGLDPGSGGLGQVSLVALGDQAGGVPVQLVQSPGFGASGSR